jgi:hypothetical protein
MDTKWRGERKEKRFSQKMTNPDRFPSLFLEKALPGVNDFLRSQVGLNLLSLKRTHSVLPDAQIKECDPFLAEHVVRGYESDCVDSVN